MDLAWLLALGSTIVLASSCGKLRTRSPQSAGAEEAVGRQLNWSRLGVDGYNVYSPHIIMQNGMPVMYFGGWYTAKQSHHDVIFRAHCPQWGKPCEKAAVILEPKALGFNHLNDPTIVQLKDGRYALYMTGVEARSNGLNPVENDVYMAHSTDGIHWDKPHMLVKGAWLPSAVIGAGGQVLLYANSTVDGKLGLYELGAEGGKVERFKALELPKNYDNVDVRYDAEKARYFMLAEKLTPVTPNQIDELESPNGRDWQVRVESLVRPHPDQLYVRTPHYHPQNHRWIAYAESNSKESVANRIWMGEVGNTPAIKTHQLIKAESSAGALWPARALLDGDASTAYSSGAWPKAGKKPWASVHTLGPVEINAIRLRARMGGPHAQALGFPGSYRIFLTTPGNTSWVELGVYNATPDASGEVVITLPYIQRTWGVKVEALTPGNDREGGWYFQLADIAMGMLDRR